MHRTAGAELDLAHILDHSGITLNTQYSVPPLCPLYDQLGRLGANLAINWLHVCSPRQPNA